MLWETKMKEKASSARKSRNCPCGQCGLTPVHCGSTHHLWSGGNSEQETAASLGFCTCFAIVPVTAAVFHFVYFTSTHVQCSRGRLVNMLYTIWLKKGTVARNCFNIRSTSCVCLLVLRWKRGRELVHCLYKKLQTCSPTSRRPGKTLFDLKNRFLVQLSSNFQERFLMPSSRLAPNFFFGGVICKITVKFRFLVRFRGKRTTRFSQTLFDYNTLVSRSIFLKFSGKSPGAILLPQ